MRNIKIACIADTHEQAQNIPGGIPQCDILVHAGDMTFLGEYDKLLKFNDWGGKIFLPETRKICVAGNHDKTLEGDIETARALLPHWTYLQDEAYEVFGLKFWGTPWSAEYHPESWGFQLERGEKARAQWEAIPEDTDVLIVHGPPFGYGDKIESGDHVGCKELAYRLMDVRPRLTICGHVHTDPGVFAAPWGTVVNAATMTGGYKPKRKPIVVNLRVSD